MASSNLRKQSDSENNVKSNDTATEVSKSNKFTTRACPDATVGRRDTMSESHTESETPARTVGIPSLLTNSCRAVMETFGGEIIQLKAHGSVATTNQTIVDELAQYGLIREQQTNHRLMIDYTQLQNTDGSGVSNPLDEQAQQSILDQVDAILGLDSKTVEPDLAVTSVTIRITDERLAAVTPAQTAEFDLTFVADAAEEPIRETTQRLNKDRGLYTELGFNIQNLNLRSVIETETKYTQQSDGLYMSWRGPEDIRPRSPDRLAVRINNHVLPDTYGTLKQYRVVDDSVLELAEDTDDTETLADQLDADSSGGDK